MVGTYFGPFDFSVIEIFYLVAACLYFLYCIICCTGLLKRKILLFSGILMHLIFISGVTWELWADEASARAITTLVLSIIVFATLWLILYLVQSNVEKSVALK